jgi:hypothetical protein
VSSLTREFLKSQCPYCGETIELAIDCSVAEQEYIEDCYVCCRPIQVVAYINDEGIPSINLYDENN